MKCLQSLQAWKTCGDSNTQGLAPRTVSGKVSFLLLPVANEHESRPATSLFLGLPKAPLLEEPVQPRCAVRGVESSPALLGPGHHGDGPLQAGGSTDMTCAHHPPSTGVVGYKDEIKTPEQKVPQTCGNRIFKWCEAAPLESHAIGAPHRKTRLTGCLHVAGRPIHIEMLLGSQTNVG